MRKTVIFSVVAVIIISLLFTGCTFADDGGLQIGEPPENSGGYVSAEITIGYVSDPISIGLSKLFDDNNIDACENSYNIKAYDSLDDLKEAIFDEKVDIATVPTSLAAKLYTSTDKNIKMLAISSLSNYTLLQSGNRIKEISDFSGKTIYTTGKGTELECVLKYFVDNNVFFGAKVEYAETNEEIAEMLLNGTAVCGILPEPFATNLIDDNNILSRLSEFSNIWPAIGSGQIAEGCVIGRKEFIDEHAEQVNMFLSEYEESVNFAKTNTAYTAEICESYGISKSAKEIKNAISHCYPSFYKGSGMKYVLTDYYNLLLKHNPELIGNSLPDDSFYYTN